MFGHTKPRCPRNANKRSNAEKRPIRSMRKKVGKMTSLSKTGSSTSSATRNDRETEKNAADDASDCSTSSKPEEPGDCSVDSDLINDEEDANDINECAKHAGIPIPEEFNITNFDPQLISPAKTRSGDIWSSYKPEFCGTGPKVCVDTRLVKTVLDFFKFVHY